MDPDERPCAKAGGTGLGACKPIARGLARGRQRQLSEGSAVGATRRG